jgi:hypothetical protein
LLWEKSELADVGHMKWDGWETVIEHRDLDATPSHRIKRRGDLDRDSLLDEGIEWLLIVRFFLRISFCLGISPTI